MVLVTGATGFLGRCICRKLEDRGVLYAKTSLSLGTDLRVFSKTDTLFKNIQPDYVLNCAAFVGGIQFGQKHQAEMFRNNLLMTVNLLECCCKYRVRRMINPISNCAYPGTATLFKESEFWDGPLHDSVMVYGMTRKMSWVGAWAYFQQYHVDSINLILSNMYGPGDHFEEERSHAMGALIMKIVNAKEKNIPEVVVWGSGDPVREWLFIDDGAEAMIRAMEIESHIEPINIGIAQGISIRDMALMIKNMIGYKGKLVYDRTKIDGAPYKTVDGTIGKELLKWSPETSLEEGIKKTLEWYCKSKRNRGQ